MRLGLKPSSWTQFNSTGGSGTLLDVHLSPADEANLSQLWFIDHVEGNLCLQRNHALGENWSLAPDAALQNNEKLGEEARKTPMAHMQSANERNTRSKCSLIETSDALTDSWFGIDKGFVG